jgi:hypothetical protein
MITGQSCFEENPIPIPDPSFNITKNYTESLATFQIPVNVNSSTNSDGIACAFGMPPYHSEMGGYRFNEVLDCEVPAYSKQGIWCGVTSFATSNCTGPPILQRYDMQIGSCDEELKGTYWQVLSLNGSHLW